MSAATMNEPELTDDEKGRLALLAGCEVEWRTDPETHAIRGYFKYPLGFQWDGQRWIVSELRAG